VKLNYSSGENRIVEQLQCITPACQQEPKASAELVSEPARVGDVWFGRGKLMSDALPSHSDYKSCPEAGPLTHDSSGAAAD